jgi:hypothetical protein
MTDDKTIWKALQEYLPKGRWIPLGEIFTTIRTRLLLDREDLVRSSSHSRRLHWEVNVRRLLRLKTRTGGVHVRRNPSAEK